MRGDLKIRKISALSGTKAVQIIRYVDRKCVVIRHVGSAKTEIDLDALMKEAECLREELCLQPSLFPETRHDKPLLHEKYLSLQTVTHIMCFVPKTHDIGTFRLPSIAHIAYLW